MKRVRGPVKGMAGVRSSPLFLTVLTTPASELTVRRAARAARHGSLMRAAMASTSSWVSVGMGSGSHGSSGGSTGGASGSRSKSWLRRSAPVTPSMAEWWILEIRATRPSLPPSATHISQRGRWRSRGRDIRSPTRAASSWVRPGAGQVTRCMWLVMSKSGSSIHTGWSKDSGTSTSRRRKGFSRCRRCSIMLDDPVELVAAGHVGGIDDDDPGHVHVPGRRLGVEEGGVHPGEPFHPVPPLRGPSAGERYPPGVMRAPARLDMAAPRRPDAIGCRSRPLVR